jgi:hypothetical protein
MIRRLFCFAFASTLLCGGIWCAYMLLFEAVRRPRGLLFGIVVFAGLGGYWLWVDFLGPWLGHKVENQ